MHSAKPDAKPKPKKALAKGPPSARASTTTNTTSSTTGTSPAPTTTTTTTAGLHKKRKSEGGLVVEASAPATGATKAQAKKPNPKRTSLTSTSHKEEEEAKKKKADALPALQKVPGRRESAKTAVPAIGKRKGLPATTTTTPAPAALKEEHKPQRKSLSHTPAGAATKTKADTAAAAVVVVPTSSRPPTGGEEKKAPTKLTPSPLPTTKLDTTTAAAAAAAPSVHRPALPAPLFASSTNTNNTNNTAAGGYGSSTVHALTNTIPPSPHGSPTSTSSNSNHGGGGRANGSIKPAAGGGAAAVAALTASAIQRAKDKEKEEEEKRIKEKEAEEAARKKKEAEDAKAKEKPKPKAASRKTIKEEEEDEEEEEEEADTPPKRKKQQAKTKNNKALAGLRLTTKVSREGDVNVKVVYITPKMKFSAYVDELMLRFGFQSPEDFDMYCVDRSGDHVDIDVAADFVSLTAPYWERLQQGGSATSAAAATASTTASKSSVAGDWSDDTVLRLYVRESFALRQKRASSFMSAATAASHTPPAAGAPLRISVGNWGDVLNATTNSNTGMTSANTNNAFNNLPGSSPGNISLLFAETQNSTRARIGNNFNKTVVVNANEELQWSRMNIIGKGSYGTVYEGITNDGKMLAVKVQEIPLEEEGAAEMKALEEEINLMSSLKHEHIVAYYGCQVKTLDNGSRQMEIFIELCHGGSLTQLRQKFVKANEVFSISLVRSYTRQVLEGLRYLHASHVMHRDIKSDNVLISASGEAKLADFGCSKRISTANVPGGGAQGGYQTMVGSPFFMAPEVMNGSEGGYSYAADVWSVGCLVLELLGRQPWITPAGSNVFQIMFQISKSKTMPTGVPKTCPAVLYNFFERVFERDPSKRATAAELLEHPWITCPDSELEEVPLDPEEEAAAAAAVAGAK